METVFEALERTVEALDSTVEACDRASRASQTAAGNSGGAAGAWERVFEGPRFEPPPYRGGLGLPRSASARSKGRALPGACFLTG